MIRSGEHSDQLRRRMITELEEIENMADPLAGGRQMSVAASSTGREETPMQKEQRIFNELFVRLTDALLNRLFDLSPRAAKNRRQYLIFLFLLTGFLITLINYPLADWADYIQDVFVSIFNPAYPRNYPGNPIYNLVTYAIEAITDPRTLQYLPIFLAPFFIALQTAANYLADVFEVDNPAVARHFIDAVALSGSNETIRIKEGKILEEHRTLPTYLIGGPGRVMMPNISLSSRSRQFATS